MAKSEQLGSQLPPELEGFSIQASVDFIEVELTLATPSQWHALKRRADAVWENVFVESLEREESSHKFRFKVQNPLPPGEFMRQVQGLQREGELLQESAVRITGVEISLDARHPSNALALLADAALYFARHHAHVPRGFLRITTPPYFDSPHLAAKYAKEKSDHAIATKDARRNGTALPPSFQRKRGTCSVVQSRREALKALQRGLSINQGRAPNDDTGDRGDSHRSRHYVKTKDTKNGEAYAPLPPKQYSARSEKTLVDADVPFTTVEEWRNFRYESLSRLFELVSPTPSANPLVGLIHERTVQFGFNADELRERPRHPEAVPQSREPGYRRKFKCGTHPDTKLNEKIRKALWYLTERSRVEKRKISEPTQPLTSEVKHDLEAPSPKYSNTITVKQTETCKQSLLTGSTNQATERRRVGHANRVPVPVRKQAGRGPTQCGPPKGLNQTNKFRRLMHLLRVRSSSASFFRK